MIVQRGVVTSRGTPHRRRRRTSPTRALRLSGRPQGQFTLVGPVDLAVLDRHVFRSDLGFAGTARWNGLLSDRRLAPAHRGADGGDGGRVQGVAVPRFASWLSYDGTSGLVLRDLDLDALGGSARLSIDVPPTATHLPVHIRGPVRAIDGEGVLRMIFGWGQMRLATAATGEVDVSWPKGQSRRVSGTHRGRPRRARRRTQSRSPGRLDWSAEDGRQTYERADLHTPGMSGTVTGTMDVEERADLAVDGETADIAATEVLLTRVRRALGNPEAQGAGFTGRGAFHGLWRGTTDWPVFDGRFDRRRGSATWGRLGRTPNGPGPSTRRRRRSSRARSSCARGRPRSAGTDGPRSAGSASGTRSTGRHASPAWPVEDIVKFMGWEVVATGRATGEATTHGRRSAPEGEARRARQEGRYYSVPYDEAESPRAGRAAWPRSPGARLRLGGRRVASGAASPTTVSTTGPPRWTGVDLGALAPPPAPGVVSAAGSPAGS